MAIHCQHTTQDFAERALYYCFVVSLALKGRQGCGALNTVRNRGTLRIQCKHLCNVIHICKLQDTRRLPTQQCGCAK